MLARTWSVGLAGVTGTPVEVEVDNAQGLPGIALVGLPDAVVRQSLDRVRAALGNVGHALPQRKFTIGLSPASMPKQGSGFDLAIAVGLLAACQVVPRTGLDDLVFLGELGLDGSVRAVRGVLPAVLAASRTGRTRVVVPRANADEAALVPGVEVLAVGELAEVLAHLTGRVRAAAAPAPSRRPAGRRARTCPTWSARPPVAGRWRSPPPAGTTCSCPVHRARARPCWPSGCPGCCRR